MMPRLSVLICVGVLAVVRPVAATDVVTAGTIDAQAAIDTSRAKFVAAYEAGNVAALVDAYHEDATFAGTLQPFWLEGRTEIQDLWERFVAAWPNRRLIFRQPELRFYGDATSVETGYLEMLMSPPDTTTYIRYSITRVDTDQGWKIANMNVARLPSSP